MIDFLIAVTTLLVGVFMLASFGAQWVQRSQLVAHVVTGGVICTVIGCGLLVLVFSSPWFHRHTPVETAVVALLEREAPAEWNFFAMRGGYCSATVAVPGSSRQPYIDANAASTSSRKYTFSKYRGDWYGYKLQVYAEDVNRQTVEDEVGQCIKALKEAAPEQLAKRAAKVAAEEQKEASNLASYR